MKKNDKIKQRLSLNDVEYIMLEKKDLVEYIIVFERKALTHISHHTIFLHVLPKFGFSPSLSLLIIGLFFTLSLALFLSVFVYCI